MKLNYEKYDSLNMFGTLYNFSQQLTDAMTIGAEFSLSKHYEQPQAIVFAGVGGSAIAGDIISLLIGQTCDIPMLVVRNYTLPAWVDDSTLVVCLSYSGNTEETLSLFHDAVERDAQIIGITSGGKLAQELKDRNFDFITIPDGLPPRCALGYLTVPLLYALNQLGLVQGDLEEDLLNAMTHITQYRDQWSQEDEKNLALQIAQQIYTTFPLIYGEMGKTNVIGKRWRAQLAENSKMLASTHNLPELNHNEIVGWNQNPELLKKMGVIWLIDQDMHPRIQKRLEITKKIIAPHAAYQLEIVNAGSSIMERVLHLIYLGDWVSFWCAILHQIDPTPVENIKSLKEQMSN